MGRLILALNLAAIRRAKGFKCVDRPKASARAIRVRRKYGSRAFNIDQARDAIGVRVKRRRVCERTIILNAVIGGEGSLTHVTLMTPLG
jgi:hypothetical protein